MSDNSSYWRRNLYVCLFGSFTNITAMTLLLPFLPIYVAELGVKTHAAVVEWSGIAYGVSFLGAGLLAPAWGKFADLYGRKLILMRASLAMAICMSMIGTAQNVWQLVFWRLLAGVLGGYASGAVVLVATQTPRSYSGWALGTLSTGVLAGTLLGPLIGGVLPGLIGLRGTFFLAGGVIFLAFLATCLFIHEDDPRGAGRKRPAGRSAWSMIPDRRPVIAMLLTAMLLMLANMSIEPIITVYVATLIHGGNVVLMSGVVMAGSALGSILAAPWLGRLADRVGAWKVIVLLSRGHRRAADPAGVCDQCLAACGAALPDGHVAGRIAALDQRDDPPQRARRGGGHHPGIRNVGAIYRPGGRAGGRGLRGRAPWDARGVPGDHRGDLRGGCVQLDHQPTLRGGFSGRGCGPRAEPGMRPHQAVIARSAATIRSTATGSLENKGFIAPGLVHFHPFSTRLVTHPRLSILFSLATGMTGSPAPHPRHHRHRQQQIKRSQGYGQTEARFDPVKRGHGGRVGQTRRRRHMGAVSDSSAAGS